MSMFFAGGRWVKKFNNKVYTVTIGKLKTLFPNLVKSETEKGTKEASTLWWNKTLERIASEHPKQLAYKQALSTWESISQTLSLTSSTIDVSPILIYLQTCISSGKFDNLPEQLKQPMPVGDIPTSKQLEQIVNILKLVPNKPTGLNLQGCIDKFFQHKYNSQEEKKLHRNYQAKQTLDKLVAFFGNISPNSITSLMLLDYVSDLNKQQLSSNTKILYLSFVKTFFLWCWEVELINQLPRVFAKLKIANGKNKEPIPFSNAEIKQLLDNAKPLLKLYILLALNCGYTQSDIGNLQKSEIDWNKQTITRKRTKTDHCQNTPTVCYPLWAETFALLKQYAKGEDLVFTSRNGKKLTGTKLVKGSTIKVRAVNTIGKMFDSLTKKIGLNKSFKYLRKTGATALASHEAYAFYVSHYLGHAPSTMAGKHYYQISQDQFGKAIDWLRDCLLG